MATWLEDDNGNKCSIEYFGSEEAAQKALDSLKNCKNCTNCSRCSDCSDYIGNKPKIIASYKVPVIENIHSKVMEAITKNPNEFDMSSWHTECGTTHCRAGWVITLAGEEGKALEAFHDTPLAALLIYHASSSIPISMPRFYENSETAMADIIRCAKLELEKV